jgi:hypothetical protein
MAEACPVGEGRDEPNVDPHLPDPVGRIKWSWNPWTMFCQLVGPEMRCKVCCALCCVLCLALLIFMGPMLVSNLISASITG